MSAIQYQYLRELVVDEGLTNINSILVDDNVAPMLHLSLFISQREFN